MALTIMQAILAVILHNNQSMEQAFAFFDVNTRNGFITSGYMSHQIEWIRGENTAPYYRVDKKGRLFVARKFENVSSWKIDMARKKNNLRVRPATIQMNVLRASGKRGGYLIRLHVQTPVLARTKKFQFHGKWVGYWASETMLENGLWTKSSNGKFGKALYIKDTISHRIVMESVEMLNHAIRTKNISKAINGYEMFPSAVTDVEWVKNKYNDQF